MFRKVLVANRGEIAVRVLRALKELGIPSVAVYSEVDRASLHVQMADEAAYLGPAPAKESYLHIPRILDAARRHGADAIHPGYGFLSENARFAAACEEAGITFIGPSSCSIALMGSKPQGRRLAIEAGVPVIPGTERPLSNYAEAAAVAAQIGYPVLLKAAAGGGGKGMRLVRGQEELEAAMRDASSEAERAFASGEVYLEKAVPNPRHIEIQVFGDHHGHLIHLGERECSLQRRHQKIIEESPSPFIALHPELRHRMGDAAVRVARAAGYYNAGTVEFLVDQEGNFYYLEMNTRLQVEHPVTELVTGLDLVHLQLRVAAGEPLPLRQEDICWRGAAMECRIYAEDPDNHFFPSPGRITRLDRPAGPGVRVDSGIYQGWTVPMEYDPLLAKLVVWSGDRPTTIERMLRALSEYSIYGIQTTIGFFRQILLDPRFRAGELHTGFVDQFFRDRTTEQHLEPELEAVAAWVALCYARQAQPPAQRVPPSGISPWLLAGRSRLLR